MPTVEATLMTSGAQLAASSAITASVTLSQNRLYVIVIGSRILNGGNPNLPTPSGCGLTWVQQTSRQNRGKISVWYATGVPSPGAISITFSGQTQENISWDVIEFFNVDLTTPIVQSNANGTGGANTSLTVTLSAFGSVNNATFGTIMQGDGTSTIACSGFTTLSDHQMGNTAGEVQTNFKNSNQTSVAWTFAGDMQAIAMEIKYKQYIPKNRGFIFLLT